MESDRSGGRIRAAAGLLVVATIGTALLVKGLYPANLPASRNPDFVDNVFDNRAVLLAARLLLVSAAAVLALGGVFIVVSIGHRMKNREWLRRVGPFEISEGEVSQAEDENDFWRRTALANQKEFVELKERIKESDAVTAELLDRL